MKKILSALLLGTLVSSCYKDLGNYDYNFDGVNEIAEVEFSHDPFEGLHGTTIEVQQPLRDDRTERITVNVRQTTQSGLDHLDFNWILRYTEINGRDTIHHHETVHTKGYLDLLLRGGKASRYRVQLEIKDNVAQLSKYYGLIVQTRPIYKNSLFVLHGSGQESLLGNIEEASQGAIVTYDAYKQLYPDGGNPFAKASKMSFSTYYDLRKRDGVGRLALFTSDGEGMVYDPFGLEKKFAKNYVMPHSERPFIVRQVAGAGDMSVERMYWALLGYDGRFYVANNFYAFHEYANRNNLRYEAEALALTESRVVAWDRLGSRFIVVRKADGFERYKEDHARSGANIKNLIADANVDFSTLRPDMSPVGKRAVYGYVNYKEDYENAHPFFIFMDESSKRFYSCELTPTSGGKGDGKDDGKGDGKSDDKKDDDKKDDGKSDDKKDDDKKDDDKKDDKKDDDKKDDGKGDENVQDGSPMYNITMRPMRNIHAKINPQTIIYNTWFTTNYIFYGAGNVVYRYNISSGDNEEIYVAPEGYNVVVLKFRTDDSNTNFLKDLGRYLSIGLNKGEEGAVAEVKLTTSADVDTSFPIKLHTQDKQGRKFGNIKDLQFAYPYRL